MGCVEQQLKLKFIIYRTTVNIISVVGSSKSMEPSMGVELTKNMRGEVKLPSKQQAMEYHVENIIMDGDTSSHIHDNVS